MVESITPQHQFPDLFYSLPHPANVRSNVPCRLVPLHPDVVPGVADTVQLLQCGVPQAGLEQLQRWRLKLDGVLGRGATGSVYCAIDLDSDMKYALKVRRAYMKCTGSRLAALFWVSASIVVAMRVSCSSAAPPAVMLSTTSKQRLMHMHASPISTCSSGVHSSVSRLAAILRRERQAGESQHTS